MRVSRLWRDGLVAAALLVVQSRNGTKLATSERKGEIHAARYCRPSGDPGPDRELGALARRPHVGSLSHGLAQGRPDVGDLVSGLIWRIHPRQPGRLRPRRAHHAYARWHEHRYQRKARHRADQDDDLAARKG